jgi:hypothetical protein
VGRTKPTAQTNTQFMLCAVLYFFFDELWHVCKQGAGRSIMRVVNLKDHLL